MYGINWHFVIKDNNTDKTFSFLVSAPNERLAIRFMREHLAQNKVCESPAIVKFNRVEEKRVVLIDKP